MSDPGGLAGLGTQALLALCLLGAYHGINPAMGWLFAVGLGMQEQSSRAVGRSLLPIALGHALAMGAVVLVAGLAQAVLPLAHLRVAVAAVLVSFGAYCLLRQRHPGWGGMRVGFRDLTIWSFLMASAHGAGFMLLPLLLGGAPAGHAGHGESFAAPATAAHAGALGSPLAGFVAVLIHTLSYLAVTGLVAWVVYTKLGLALLRKAWLNLDWVWGVALIATGAFTLLM